MIIKPNIKNKVIFIFSFIYANIRIFPFHKLGCKRPKISIFLPIYNKELYIKNSIQSLQDQTLKDIEIVAVNDGSTDNTLKILKKLSKHDKRIKIINNDRNHGVLYSRSMGILNSTGEYLMNLDPDDRLMSNDDLNFLYKNTEFKRYDNLIYLIKRIPVNKSDIEYFKYLDNNQLNMRDDHITNKLVKKDLFLKAYHNYENEIFGDIWNFHDDNIWSFLVRKFSNSTKIIKKYIYCYKRNKDSLNLKFGSALDLKNRFYKLKKFLEVNLNFSNKLFEYYLFNYTNNYHLFKNNEIKKNIVKFCFE